MNRNGFSKIKTCPLCKKCDETWKHVYECKSISVKTNRMHLYEKLKQSLQKKKNTTSAIATNFSSNPSIVWWIFCHNTFTKK